MAMIDPFELKRLPKWHSKRLLFTAWARSQEFRSKLLYEHSATPFDDFQGQAPSGGAATREDSAVTAEQLACLLACLEDTEPLGGVVVEVGSYRGATTGALAGRTSRKVIPVDPFVGYGGYEADYALFRAAIADLLNVFHERKTSGQAARDWSHGPISFVSIDAVHDR
jgi:hypothetical protein